MLDEDSDETFDGSEHHPVNHDGAVLLAVRAGVFQVKPQRQLEIQLDGTALPGSSQGILQMEVDLGTVESAISLVDDVGKSQVVQGAPQGVGGHLPVLVASHAVLRAGGQLHMVFEAEQAVNAVDQVCHALDLIPDLLRHHEDMGIVLGKAAHPHQSVHLAGFFVAVYDSQLAHPQRQIPVGAGLGFIDQNTAGAVHGFDGEIFLVDDRGVHIFLIMIPVAGGLPQMTAQHDGGGNLHITGLPVDFSPVIQQLIFQHHAVGKEERKSRAFLPEHEQSQLFSQLSVVALFGFLQHVKVFLQLGLL